MNINDPKTSSTITSNPKISDSGIPRVDFSYAFVTPHRLTVCLPDSSDKTLVDCQAGSIPRTIAMCYWLVGKIAPIKSVIVNGKPWTAFNLDKETITLKDLNGTVTVTAQY